MKKLIQLGRERPVLAFSLLFLGLVFVLNYLTLLLADDYGFLQIFGDGKYIDSIKDTPRAVYNFYNLWGGRVVGALVTIFFVQFNKLFFDVANSIVYVLFIYMLFRHTRANKVYSVKLTQALMFTLIFFFAWFSLPFFGETVLWLTGSANYLWLLFILVCFLLAYRSLVDDIDNSKYGKKWWQVVLIFIFGILAGWTSENNSPAVLIMAIAFMILARSTAKSNKLPIWTFAGLVGMVIGLYFLIKAPGNAVRAGFFPASTLHDYASRFFDATLRFNKEFLVITIAFPLLYALSLMGEVNRKKIFVPLIYLLGMLISNYAMILSPTAPERTLFGAMTFGIIACVTCLVNIKLHEPKRVLLIANLIFAIVFCVTYTFALVDLGYGFVQFRQRVSYMNEQKALGNYDVSVPLIFGRSKYNPLSSGGDLGNKPTTWSNMNFAHYYGLKSVSGISRPAK